MERLTFILASYLLRLSIWVNPHVIKGLLKEALNQEDRVRKILKIKPTTSPWA